MKLIPTLTDSSLHWRQSKAFFRSAQICGNKKRRRLRVALPEAGSLLCLRILLGFADGDGLADIADLETGEAADRDVFAQLADLAGDQLMHGDARLFHERLIEQAHLFVEL